MLEFECVWNGDISISINKRKDWVLYINECYWVLDIDDNFEFYFNPIHFIGKMPKKALSDTVIEYIKSECICFDYEKLRSREKTELTFSRTDMERLEKNMRIGNRFYAQGYTYITHKGKFIRRIDPYNIQEECDFFSLKSDIVCDMLRMIASTKSHHYIRQLFDLNCFKGKYSDVVYTQSSDSFAWDSSLWKIKYEELSEKLKSCPDCDSYKADMRGIRKDVFMHTLYVVQNGKYHTDNGDVVKFPESENMICNTCYYFSPFSIDSTFDYKDTEITVENADCLVVAKNLLNEGYKPAVLNMANRQTPGGGVYNGAGAQEENLFRRTNLFQSLYQFSKLANTYKLPRSKHSYPLDRNYGGIYSPDVIVFRGEEKDGYPLLDNYYQVAVIYVAGMNRPELDCENRIASHLVEGVKNKIRTILNIAYKNGHDCVVLGALGCGAFQNPPAHVAKLFHEVIESEFKNRFKKICFAVLEDHNSKRKNSNKGNFLPFYEEFCN